MVRLYAVSIRANWRVIFRFEDGYAEDVDYVNHAGFERLPCLALYAKNGIMKPSETLAAHRDELRQLISRYNVARPRVYGSVLTGKDDDESDLDLLVDATERTTLFTLAGLEHEAQQLLGVQVSVLTPQDLPTKFRNKVLQAAQPL